jgi:hypothetical protein
MTCKTHSAWHQITIMVKGKPRKFCDYIMSSRQTDGGIRVVQCGDLKK